MKPIFLLISTSLLIANSMYAQVACSIRVIETSAVAKPSNAGSAQSNTCSDVNINWQGHEHQTYMVTYTYTDIATGKTTVGKSDQASRKGKNYNYSLTLPIKPGSTLTWSIQAIQTIDNRTFYSYPVRGEFSGCDKTEVVANKTTDKSAVARSKALFKPELNIFPNPATSELTIKWTDTYQGNARLTITDASGKTIKQTDINKKLPNYLDRVIVNNLTAGIYFMQIQMQNGKKISTRFVKN